MTGNFSKLGIYLSLRVRVLDFNYLNISKINNILKCYFPQSTTIYIVVYIYIVIKENYYIYITIYKVVLFFLLLSCFSLIISHERSAMPLIIFF